MTGSPSKIILYFSACLLQSRCASRGSVSRVFLANPSSRILRDQVGFHKFVQFVQVDIAEYRTNDPTLGDPRERRKRTPFLQISSLKQLVDETQKPWIVDLFSQDAQHDGVVKSIKTGFDVSFNKPVAPCPRVFNVTQCRVTASFRSITMRVFAELRLVIRL